MHHENDDAVDCGIGMCEALRLLLSPWQDQDALSKGEPCNCLPDGQGILLHLLNLPEQGLSSSALAIATIEGKPETWSAHTTQ